MTHELPNSSRQSAASAALQHTRKHHSSLLSTGSSDSVSLRIRRRCHKRLLQPLDIPTSTTDDSRDALSFRWWALPSPSVTKRQASRKAPDAVVSITIVPPALASLAASLSSLECSLATGLATSRMPTKVVLPGTLL